MKKLMTAAVMLTAIVCTNANANAENVPTHKLTNAQGDEVFSIWKSHSDKKITDSEYERRLEECSDSGNIRCSSSLGIHYYLEGENKKAYPLLMKSQGAMQYPNGYTVAPSEFYLGDMFRWGHGVMQSDDKSMHHYRIGAIVGDKECALGVYSSHLRKVQAAKVDSPAYQSAVKNTYAWLKVSQGLGVESYDDAKAGVTKLNAHIRETRKMMVDYYGESFANDADDRASAICSMVPGCIQ